MIRFRLLICVSNNINYDNEWVELPITIDKFKKILKRIGLKENSNNWSILGYEYSHPKLLALDMCNNNINNLNELNYFATKSKELTDSQYEMFINVIDLEDIEYFRDLINIIINIDSYHLLNGIHTIQDLGLYFFSKKEKNLNLGEFINYIDYRKYGINIDYELNSKFVNKGYIYRESNVFIETYKDIYDIPKQYLLF